MNVRFRDLWFRNVSIRRLYVLLSMFPASAYFLTFPFLFAFLTSYNFFPFPFAFYLFSLSAFAYLLFLWCSHFFIYFLSLSIVFLFPFSIFSWSLFFPSHFSPAALFLWFAAIISLCIFLSSPSSPLCSLCLPYCQLTAHSLALLLSVTPPQTNVNVIPLCACNRIPPFK